VENISQLNVLSELKCNLMQGPIIHHALSAEEVSGL
jgi:EAL domain-containing protein (putative c-di-GMP-specific phosphodiesterase class I)